MSNKSIGAVTVGLACAVACQMAGSKPGPGLDGHGIGPGDHGSFARARKDLRKNLQGAVGDAGVNVDDPNTIVIGVVDNPNSPDFRNASRDPSEMHVLRGKSPTITWVCWDGRFRLHFVSTDAGMQSPLQEGADIDGGDSTPSVARAKIDPNAPPGRYSFTVHVDMADGGTYDDPYCPPIIID
jgi:hypothetical protein